MSIDAIARIRFVIRRRSFALTPLRQVILGRASSIKDGDHSLVEGVSDAGHDCWFCPDLVRDNAEEILEATSEGTFLVRGSSAKPGHFVLSVKNETVKHMRILRIDGNVCISRKITFATVPELVQYYRVVSLAESFLTTQTRLLHSAGTHGELSFARLLCIPPLHAPFAHLLCPPPLLASYARLFCPPPMAASYGRLFGPPPLHAFFARLLCTAFDDALHHPPAPTPGEKTDARAGGSHSLRCTTLLLAGNCWPRSLSRSRVGRAAPH